MWAFPDRDRRLKQFLCREGPTQGSVATVACKHGCPLGSAPGPGQRVETVETVAREHWHTGACDLVAQRTNCLGVGGTALFLEGLGGGLGGGS